jgi:hypothetical protein
MKNLGSTGDWCCLWHGRVLGLSPTTSLIYNVRTCRWEHCEVATLRTRTEVSYDHVKCTAGYRKDSIWVPSKCIMWFKC